MIPKTPLSFVYHVTLDPPHRDELHHNILDAFARHGITDDGFAKFANYEAVPSAEAFRTASFNIERAAYQIRGEGSEDGLDAMVEAAAELFRLLAPCLAHELAEGLSGPLVQPGNQPWLLGGLYDTFYSTQRAAKPRLNGALANHLSPQANTDLFAAWEVVHTSLQQPPGPAEFDRLLAHTSAICEALATEYALGAGCWSQCW